MRVMKNLRIRSHKAESRRREKWQEKNVAYMQNRQDHKEVQKEKRDRVPPLRRDIPKYGYSTSEQRKICEPKSRPRSLLSQTTTSVSYTYIDVHQDQLEALDTVAVARLPGVNVIEERRQRSETPPRRRTRSRTDSRSTQGAFWTNTGRQSRRDVPDVPEPPAPPPRRQTGVQWLHSGAWQPNPAPPTNRNSGRGYFQPP